MGSRGNTRGVSSNSLDLSSPTSGNISNPKYKSIASNGFNAATGNYGLTTYRQEFLFDQDVAKIKSSKPAWNNPNTLKIGGLTYQKVSGGRYQSTQYIVDNNGRGSRLVFIEPTVSGGKLVDVKTVDKLGFPHTTAERRKYGYSR